MGLIPNLIDFSPGTTIKSADVDGNFSAIRDTMNTYGAFKDVPNVWTFPQTYNEPTAFNNTITFGLGTGGIQLNQQPIHGKLVGQAPGPYVVYDEPNARWAFVDDGGVKLDIRADGRVIVPGTLAVHTNLDVIGSSIRANAFRPPEGTATNPYFWYNPTLPGWQFADDFNVKLTIWANRIVEAPVGFQSPALRRGITNDLLVLQGGTDGANGAAIQLMGGTHSTNPGNMFLDAAGGIIYFRTGAGFPTQMTIANDGNVNMYRTLFLGSQNQTAGEVLKLFGTGTNTAVLVGFYANGVATVRTGFMGFNAGDPIFEIRNERAGGSFTFSVVGNTQAFQVNPASAVNDGDTSIDLQIKVGGAYVFRRVRFSAVGAGPTITQRCLVVDQ